MFSDGIGTIESYLVNQAQITDFYKTKMKAHTIKHPNDVAKHIALHYSIDDITTDHTSKLMIIVDRRRSMNHDAQYDSMYIFPYQDNDRFSELKSNYFVCFQFKIMRNKSNHGRNKLMTYFSFGLNGITRFFPEMLVSIIRRFFRRPHDLSEAQYLRK
eukprot:281475_1